MWIIYKHTNTINGKVYIGQTKQTLHSRWKCGKGYKDSYFSNAIEKYGWESFSHEILERDIETQDLANDREIYWINFYHSYVGDKKCNGYNMTLGGNNRDYRGEPVYCIDKKSLKIVAEYPSAVEAARSLSGNENNSSGIRDCCLGIKHSRLGYFWCYKNKYNTNWRPKNNDLKTPVLQLDDNYQIIKRFNSITDAAKEGYSRSSIIACCLRKQRKASNYYWCYASDYNKKWKPANTRYEKGTKIYCFETDTVYDNLKLAAENTGANISRIARCCKGLDNASNGMHFCYFKDKNTYKIKQNKDESPCYCINTGKYYKTMIKASKETGCCNVSLSCRLHAPRNGLSFCYANEYYEGMKPYESKRK